MTGVGALLACAVECAAMLENVERRRVPLPERGVEIALMDWGGDGPLALLHHANGFCAALWDPVAQQIRSHYRVVAIDARGHGDSSRPPRNEDYHWDNFTGDLIAVADRVCADLGYARVTLGMGHSFGGTCTALAAAKRGDLYERIAMVDPVLMPPPEMREAYMARRPPFSLAELARKRRAVFPSRQAVIEAWSKPTHAFSTWDPRALEIYAQEGFREREDGQVELKCATDVEAAVFENNTSLDPFAFAPHISVPTRILWASQGNFPRATYEAFASRIPHAEIVDVDAGHLVTMERPALVAELILAFDP